MSITTRTNPEATVKMNTGASDIVQRIFLTPKILFKPLQMGVSSY